MEYLNFTWPSRSLEVKQFSLDLLPDEHSSFKGNLFDRIKHLRTQGHRPIISFLLYRHPSSQILASVHFSKKTEEPDFQSPPHAPFGGISCTADCSIEELDFLLSCVAKTAGNEKLIRIIITTPPSCYNNRLHNLLDEAYIGNGYVHIEKYLNLHIEIDARPFIQTISPQEVRRYRKCKKAGFEAKREGILSVNTVYTFIKDSFHEKNYLLSITESQLENLFFQFLDDFLLFTVRNNGQLVAVSVAVRVNKKVLYNFLIADLLSYRSFSPSVMLYEKLYSYCQSEGIEILDQGISVNHNGVEKPNLIRFKKNMGGKESFKITYQKQL